MAAVVDVEVAAAVIKDEVVAAAVIKDEMVAVAEEDIVNTLPINRDNNNTQVDTNRITIITIKVGSSINSRELRRMATPTKGFHRHHRGGEPPQRLQRVRTPIPRCEITIMWVHGDVRDTETTSPRASMTPIIAGLRLTWSQSRGCHEGASQGRKWQQGTRGRILKVSSFMNWMIRTLCQDRCEKERSNHMVNVSHSLEVR